MNIAWPLRIWYDRSCGLCRTELHALRDHDTEARLELVDCSAPGFADAELDAEGVSAAQAMAWIHARDASGRWLRGVDVFEAAYAAVGLHGMAAAWGHPRLRPLWNRLYPFVARHRQRLSALGLSRPYGWLVRKAAGRAMARSLACTDSRSCRREP